MDSIYLSGSSEVEKAGRSMRDAADTFAQNAQWLIEAMRELSSRMRETVERLEALAERTAPKEPEHGN